MERAAGIGENHGPDPKKRQGFQGNAHGGGIAAFIIMHPALKEGDVAILGRPQNKAALMAADLPRWKMRDGIIGEGNSIAASLGDGSKTGSQDNGNGWPPGAAMAAYGLGSVMGF